MKPRFLFTVLLIATGWAAAPVRGAVILSSLGSPSLQTLINLGSTGVDVGNNEFSNFSFVDVSTGASRTASQVQVQPLTIGGYGLQFISGWSTGDGSTLDDVISYDVKSLLVGDPIDQISLISNGTAPAPAAGTYTAATLISQLPNGTPAASVLSNYNDGTTNPVDTTKPDVNYATAIFLPQNTLHITDTVIASSAAAGLGTGGVATVTVVQNAFVDVPEPTQFFGIIVPLAGWIGFFGRRRLSR